MAATGQCHAARVNSSEMVWFTPVMGEKGRIPSASLRVWVIRRGWVFLSVLFSFR
jgi:hypothetical protein